MSVLGPGGVGAVVVAAVVPVLVFAPLMKGVVRHEDPAPPGTRGST